MASDQVNNQNEDEAAREPTVQSGPGGAQAAPAVELTAQEREEAIRDTRRFDLRRFLGALFSVYGVLVTGMGIAAPAADTAPTGGIPINLWTGIGMLIAGILFFVWDHFSPVPESDIVRSATESKAQSLIKAEGPQV